MREVLPAWMQKPIVGIQAWKFIAMVLLVFLALFLRRIVMFVIGNYLRRATKRAWLEKAINSSDKPMGGLVMAIVFLIGIPLLALPPDVSSTILLVAEGLCAYSIVWLFYRMVDILGGFLLGKAEKSESKLDDQLVPLVTKTLKVILF